MNDELYEEPNWRGEPEVEQRPLNISRQGFELLEKTQIKIKSFDVCLPMPGSPENYLVEATIYRDQGHYWRIEGNDNQKFNDSEEAMVYVVEMAEARRHAMLNEEAEEMFGGV